MPSYYEHLTAGDRAFLNRYAGMAESAYKIRHLHNTQPPGWFEFGELSSGSVGAVLTSPVIVNMPERDVEMVSVPGRSGDLLIDNKRWKNFKVSYGMTVPPYLGASAHSFLEQLTSLHGYHKLTADFCKGRYTMAMLTSPTKSQVLSANRVSHFEVTFSCKPYFLTEYGDTIRFFDEPGDLRNDYGIEAFPLITVYGSGPGTLTVGTATVEIKQLSDQITFDCDLQNAFRQIGDGAPENMNRSIYAPVFPVLAPGDNVVSWTGGIERVEIDPRWRTL